MTTNQTPEQAVDAAAERVRTAAGRMTLAELAHPHGAVVCMCDTMYGEMLTAIRTELEQAYKLGVEHGRKVVE